MRKVLGNKGEEIAAGYLQEQGYRILNRNYRCSYGEVDIICALKQCIVFVEVKTRISKGFGSPEESITREKKNHIRRAALVYMEANPQHCREMRFDVIGILFEGEEPRINHVVSAF